MKKDINKIMKKDIKKIWLEALRSGEYPKTEYALKTTDGFCCLGVLTDLYRKRVSKKSVEKFWKLAHGGGGDYHTNGDSAYLPEKVQKWSGVNSIDGRYCYGSLSMINDRTDTFEEVIEAIEEHF